MTPLMYLVASMTSHNTRGTRHRGTQGGGLGGSYPVKWLLCLYTNNFIGHHRAGKILRVGEQEKPGALPVVLTQW